MPTAVLDAGPNRERMIDEAHAMTVAWRRDLIDAADSAPRWRSAMTKLGARSRAHLVAKALGDGPLLA
jgi:hypothetical protein